MGHEIGALPGMIGEAETLDERVRRLEAEYREAIVRVTADYCRWCDSKAERKRAHERLLAARADQVTT